MRVVCDKAMNNYVTLRTEIFSIREVRKSTTKHCSSENELKDMHEKIIYFAFKRQHRMTFVKMVE